MKGPLTLDLVRDAAARALANGHDLRTWTPHRAAQDLVLYDSDFEGADYTQVVSLVRQWQREGRAHG